MLGRPVYFAARFSEMEHYFEDFLLSLNAPNAIDWTAMRLSNRKYEVFTMLSAGMAQAPIEIELMKLKRGI